MTLFVDFVVKRVNVTYSVLLKSKNGTVAVFLIGVAVFPSVAVYSVGVVDKSSSVVDSVLLSAVTTVVDICSGVLGVSNFKGCDGVDVGKSVIASVFLTSSTVGVADGMSFSVC